METQVKDRHCTRDFSVSFEPCVCAVEPPRSWHSWLLRMRIATSMLLKSFQVGISANSPNETISESQWASILLTIIILFFRRFFPLLYFCGVNYFFVKCPCEMLTFAIFLFFLHTSLFRKWRAIHFSSGAIATKRSRCRNDCFNGFTSCIADFASRASSYNIYVYTVWTTTRDAI